MTNYLCSSTNSLCLFPHMMWCNFFGNLARLLKKLFKKFGISSEFLSSEMPFTLVGLTVNQMQDQIYRGGDSYLISNMCSIYSSVNNCCKYSCGATVEILAAISFSDYYC